MGLRLLKAAGMRAGKIYVPDALWKHEEIDEGAKLLWCYLRVVRTTQDQFTFRHLREALGICQNSLLKYLPQLERAGWLQWTRDSLHRITCLPIWPGGGPTLLLSTDVLFDHHLPNPAKWLWGVIDRLGSSFTYQTLEKETGFCRESLIKYLGRLREHEWLPESTPTRVNRLITFAPGVCNPMEAKRRAELAELSRRMDAARNRPGYSLGQCLLALMVEFLYGGDIIENGELNGLHNPLTGGRMHYDLYLAEHRLAIEFHGRQHDRLTERFPSQEALDAQQARDRLKVELSLKKGIRLLIIRPEQLSFDELAKLLAPFVPLMTDMRGRWHIYDKLAETAERYRKKVAS